jgi:hypothetical protein
MEAVAAQLQPQPELGVSVDYRVGDQFVGHQHRPVDRGGVGHGQLPVLADLAHKGPGCCRSGRGRGQPQLVAKIRRARHGLVDGLIDIGVQPQEMRHLQPAQDLGHRRLCAAQQEASGRPAAGRVVGHRGEDGGAHRIEILHPGQVADERERLVAEVLEQGPLDLGDGVDVDAASEGNDQAAVSRGAPDLHGPPPVVPAAVQGFPPLG